MKQVGSIATPPGWDASPSQVTPPPPSILTTYLYTFVNWITAQVKCFERLIHFFYGLDSLYASHGVQNPLWTSKTLFSLEMLVKNWNSLRSLSHYSDNFCFVDMQKFPLRMKDNDLLVTELYKDPNEDMVTALSVYLTPKTCKWNILVDEDFPC